jgi:hypothetical protein
MVIVIGRGHGGTRAISQALALSGVFMGKTNPSGDLIPPQAMYEAARIAGDHVRYVGPYSWDFSGLFGAPDPAYVKHVQTYLRTITSSKSPRKGFKIPETVLSLPWFVQLFPDAKYIHWIRDPRDVVLGHHLTDRLGTFNVPNGTRHLGLGPSKVESWVYHQEIVRAVSRNELLRPKHMLTVHFEDFVLRNRQERARLSEFLGFPLAKVPLNAKKVHAFDRKHPRVPPEVLERYGYR